MRVEEEKLLEAGAVDAESIRENRRIDQMINAKRGNVPGVQFNIDDIIEKYEVIIKYWPANTLDILVKRLTGTPIQWVIQTRPRSGAELFAAIMERHGRHEEATYSVVVFDTSNKQKRGTGRITVQDTRDTPPTLQPQSQPQGSPMNPYHPYGAPPPQQPSPLASPTVQVVPPDPMGQITQMFRLFQEMQTTAQRPHTPVAPAAIPPAAVAIPAQQPPGATTVTPQAAIDPMSQVQQMFRLFQEMQTAAQPHSSGPHPTPVDPLGQMQQMVKIFQLMQSSQTPSSSPQSLDPMAIMQMMQMFQQMQTPAPQPQPQVVVTAPPPAPSTDPLAVVQQAFDMFRKMQPAPAPASQPAPQTSAATPPVNAPPGMFFVPGFGFVPAEKLFQALSGSPQSPGAGSGSGPGPGPGYRPAYGGPRPYYGGPQGGPRSYPGEDYPQSPQPPAARPKTAAEELKDAAAVVEMVVGMAERFRGPQVETPAPEPPRRADDDNPVKVVNYGDWSVLLDKKNGSTRWGETFVANTGNVLKWIAEQREGIMKANAEAERAKRPPQRTLPPGYVEVTPGYTPPPGYVAVPVDRLPLPQQADEEGLPQPPPPEHMPPPLEDEPSKATWGAPGSGG